MLWLRSTIRPSVTGAVAMMEHRNRLRTSVFEYPKILLIQTAHLMAAGIGHGDGDRHQLGMDADDGLKQQENGGE